MTAIAKAAALTRANLRNTDLTNARFSPDETIHQGTRSRSMVELAREATAQRRPRSRTR